MSKDSSKACLELIEWFEAMCKTVPNVDLSRSYFPINGHVLYVPSPGLLKVSRFFIQMMLQATLSSQPSCSACLFDLRKWIQTVLQFVSMNPDNIEAIAEVTFLGELLEREIEKEKYRPFLRSMAKCSIRSNWYSGIKTLWQSSSHQPSRPNPKRVQSTSSTSAEPSAKRITTSGVEKSSGPKKPVPHRAIIHSDNEDSDDKDDDYSVPSVSDSKKHRGSEADEHKPVVKSKPSSDSHPTIHVKPSIQSKSSSERPPKVSSSIKIRSISSSEQSLKEALQRHLDVLIKEPKYNLFVDPVPREYEDYYMIIQSPICLRDIQLKLQENEYRSVSKFKKDMLLLIGNCVYYNMLLTPAQTDNRKQAYELHRDLLRILNSKDVNQSSEKLDDMLSLERVYTEIIERVYNVRNGDYQLIRNFAVDNGYLEDYKLYVKNIINLRHILDRMFSMDYYTSLIQIQDKNCLLNDFCRLFDNCITYWKQFKPNEGRVYIDAAQLLKRQVSTFMKDVDNGLPDSVRKAFQAIRKEKEMRRAASLERKRAETNPALLSLHPEYCEKVVMKIPPPVPQTRIQTRKPDTDDLIGHTSGRWVVSREASCIVRIGTSAHGAA